LGRLRRDRLAQAALALLALMTIAAAFGPFLTPHSVEEINLDRVRVAPALEHPMGTDDLGRDLLLRVMLGGRITLVVAGVSVVVALVLGLIAGALAGFFGGLLDTLLMRAADVMLAVPVFFVVLLLSSVLAPGLLVICVLIGFTQWVEVARVVRAVVMSTREHDFVEAARAIGASEWRILFRHVLLHTSGPLAAAATIGLAQAIMLESAMSFLGFGVQPPSASWGVLLQSAQSHLAVAPWMAVFPGLMIFLAVLSCFALGDSLRSAVAPDSR
jgi:peptide/nickel transport system permease protein